MAVNLRKKALSGMIWTSFQRFSKMGIGFISGIILARLLTPFDYGCIGMLSIFMVLADSFIDCGFGSALIQKKNPTQTDYSTIFYWNIFMACILYTIIFLSAPAIARFYKIPLLCDVLRVQGLILFIYAFNIIQRNQLKKKMNFKLLAIVSLIATVVSLTVTIIMAYHGFGVWSLVAQNLILSFIPSLVFWFYVRWRPKLTFSWKSFKELFSFGAYMFLTHLVNSFYSNLQALLIGKLYNPATLGYYSKAVGLEKVASHSISSVLTSITYPLYAMVQDDKPTMISMIKRLTSSISYITFPLMFILILTAKPIFVLLYSDRWLPSVPYFQVLCIVGISSCLQAVNTQTIAAIGKSRTMFYWTLLKRGAGSSFIIIGLILYGMKGFLIGVVIYNWFCYFVNIGLVSKHIGYKWHQQLLDLYPVTVVSIVAAIISYLLVNMLNLGLYTDGIAKAFVFVMLYLAWSIIFKPSSFTYVISLIPPKYHFWKRMAKHSSNI